MSIEQELLERVFKLIARSHVVDHKLSVNYLQEIRFPRSLGEQIAEYVEKQNPEFYKAQHDKYARVSGD